MDAVLFIFIGIPVLMVAATTVLTCLLGLGRLGFKVFEKGPK